MKTRDTSPLFKAFTFVELVFVIAAIAILILVILPSRHHHGYGRIKCVNNLKQVGLSFRLFATDHRDFYPMRVSTNEGGSLEYVGSGETFRHFLVMSNDLNVPKILLCPLDDSSRREAENFTTDFNANTNVSYFVGLDAIETKPSLILSGDRQLSMNGKPLKGVVEITGNQKLKWTTDPIHSGGNIALADGSVQQTTTKTLNALFSQSGALTNRLSIPD